MANLGPGPHGGAPPHGAPPGYAPPAAYAAPPPGPPPGGPPRKPRGPGLWIALGCAAVLVLGGIAAAASWLLFARGTQQALEAFPPASAPPMLTLPPPVLVPVPVPVPPPPTQAAAAGGVSGASAPAPGRSTAGGSKTTDAGQAKAPAATGTAGAASTTVDASTAAPAPGPTCVRAMACCQLLLSKAPPGTAGLASNCSGMKSWTEAVCEQSLQSYKQAAAMLGLSCN
jgi:hypothetical protein